MDARTNRCRHPIPASAEAGWSWKACLRSTILCAGILGLIAPSLASAVPQATTTVISSCSVGSLLDREELRDRPYGQNLPCDLSVTAGGTTYHAVGQVVTGFGPGYPLAGNIHVTAEAQGGGEGGVSRASFVGTVRYFFVVEPIVSPSPTLPGGLPTYFYARGEGAVSPDVIRPGYFATAYGNAGVRGPAASTLASLEYYDNNSFEETVSMSLIPTLTYEVVLIASCQVVAGDSATCSAMVDPTIGLDQAAFDRIMGPDTFPLSRYYRLVFSENIPPVPEPQTYVMIIVGLGVLAFAVRGRK